MTDPALWLRALHIVAFAAWMASLWYMPRLFVYHSVSDTGSALSEQFKIMERRLLRAIATPAMVATLLAGIALATVQGQWADGWLHIKLLLVAGLATVHVMMVRHVREFAADQRQREQRYFRIFNEVPTVLFVIIVVMVVFKPL